MDEPACCMMAVFGCVVVVDFFSLCRDGRFLFAELLLEIMHLKSAYLPHMPFN